MLMQGTVTPRRMRGWAGLIRYCTGKGEPGRYGRSFSSTLGRRKKCLIVRAAQVMILFDKRRDSGNYGELFAVRRVSNRVPI